MVAKVPALGMVLIMITSLGTRLGSTLGILGMERRMEPSPGIPGMLSPISAPRGTTAMVVPKFLPALRRRRHKNKKPWTISNPSPLPWCIKSTEPVSRRVRTSCANQEPWLRGGTGSNRSLVAPRFPRRCGRRTKLGNETRTKKKDTRVPRVGANRLTVFLMLMRIPLPPPLVTTCA